MQSAVSVLMTSTLAEGDEVDVMSRESYNRDTLTRVWILLPKPRGSMSGFCLPSVIPRMEKWCTQKLPLSDLQTGYQTSRMRRLTLDRQRGVPCMGTPLDVESRISPCSLVSPSGSPQGTPPGVDPQEPGPYGSALGLVTSPGNYVPESS